MTEKQFEILWEKLVKKKYGKPTKPLTKQERLFYAANMLRGSIPRSGFIGYFEESTGDDIRDAHEALRIMKLDDVETILKRAEKIALRNKRLPAGNGPIMLFPDNLSEEAYEKASDELDAALTPVQDSFYECDDRLFEALCNYADQNALS